MRNVMVLVVAGAMAAACGGGVATIGGDAGSDVVAVSDVPAASDVVAVSDVPAASDVVAVSDVAATRDVVAVPDVPAASDVVAVSDVAAMSDRPSADVVATDAATSSDANTALPDREAPTFAGIYATILRPRCDDCHGPTREGSAFVMRDAATAWAALVDVPVMSRWIELCTQQWDPRVDRSYRVRPGDPGLSMLFFLPQCYVRDADHMRLTADERETIRAWILAGAPRGAL